MPATYVDMIDFVFHSNKLAYNEINRVTTSKDLFKYATLPYDRRTTLHPYIFAIMVGSGKSPCKLVKLEYSKSGET